MPRGRSNEERRSTHPKDMERGLAANQTGQLSACLALSCALICVVLMVSPGPFANCDGGQKHGNYSGCRCGPEHP